MTVPASGKGQTKQYHSLVVAAITGHKTYYAPVLAGAKKYISVKEIYLCLLPLSKNLFMVFGQDNFIIIHFVHPAERYKVVLPTGFRIAFRKLYTLAIQMVHNTDVCSAAGDNLSVIHNCVFIYHNNSPVLVIWPLHGINCSA